MDELILSGSDETPEVNFNKEKSIFYIKGVSIPEDSSTFYSKIFKWLEKYIKDPLEETILEFELEYCNTSSSKQIYEMLLIFKKVESMNKKFTINWIYDIYDDDIKDLGNSFSKLVNKEFNYVHKQNRI